MSMMTKTNPSASASTTGSLESDPRDPAVVAMMKRMDLRVARDHTSFIEILYGTDSEPFANPSPFECCHGADFADPGGHKFAEVLQTGWTRGYTVMSFSRKHVNEASELSAP
jgi:hypothetical protein